MQALINIEKKSGNVPTPMLLPKKMKKNSINEEDIKKRFKDLISTKELLEKIAQYGYEGEYTEQALYKLFDKYDIKVKAIHKGKSYFNKKNACTCIERHIFELNKLVQDLERAKDWVSKNKRYPKLFQQELVKKEPSVDYTTRSKGMDAASRECLANDDVFTELENELYRTKNEGRKTIKITEDKLILLGIKPY